MQKLHQIMQFLQSKFEENAGHGYHVFSQSILIFAGVFFAWVIFAAD